MRRYLWRIVAAAVGALGVVIWQLKLAVREGDPTRMGWVVFGFALGVAIPAFVFYARSVPRREIRKRIASFTDGELFDAKIDPHTLSQLAHRDVVSVTDLVVAVGETGLHLYPADESGGEITVFYTDIETVTFAGDDEDPYHGAGMVAFQSRIDPREWGITLRAPFLWGAFSATPTTTERFVTTLRDHLIPPS